MTLRDRLAAALATLDLDGMKVLIIDEMVGKAVAAAEELKLRLDELVWHIEPAPEESTTPWAMPPYIRPRVAHHGEKPMRLPSSYG